jgi:type II secretory pathway predicted ATPase ExeA
MNPLQNPFNPGPGLAPPVLAGRDQVLAQGRLLWGRLAQSQSQPGLLLLGLRGSGKTRLLRALAADAGQAGLRSALVEAHFGRPLALLLVPALRTLLLAQGSGPGTEGALAVLNSFSGAHTKLPAAGPSKPGLADSGDLEADLASLAEALGAAAQAQGQALLLCVDEAQALDSGELSALLWAQHRLAQAQLPFGLALAGLPCLESLSEAERGLAEKVLEIVDLEPLDRDAAALALRSPAQALGVEWDADALSEVLRQAKGLPYLLQLWGAEAWSAAGGSAIRLDAVRRAAPAAAARLDAEFYGPGFRHLSPREKNYLRSMAHLGSGPRRSSDIADSMDAKITALGPLRARLIKQGLIYSPAHGLMAFAMPGYDDFMRRVMPNFR